MTTHGFEAEFQNNANAVIAALHERGFAGDRTLHGYHCDCDYCAFDGDWLFRGQTDSSCSGEIISDILDFPDQRAYSVLAQAAVDVDAEPGPNSGFHVHVGVEGMNTRDMENSLFEFVRWEQVLTRIAGGRWPERRDGMNRTVRDCTSYAFTDHGGNRYTAGGIQEWMGRHNSYNVRDLKQSILYAQTETDRHSNLNVSQHSHPTWEFRLWNSTRSAWRMEMFCGLSVAWLNREVVQDLAELEPPTRMSRPSTGIDSIALALANNGFEQVADLLERQGAYLNDRAEAAPSVLTAL